jgi:hypothetical protein
MTKVLKLTEKQIEQKIKDAQSKYPEDYLKEKDWKLTIEDRYIFNVTDCLYFGLRYMDECMDLDWDYKYKTFYSVLPLLTELEYPLRRQNERVKLNDYIKEIKGESNDK